MSMETGAHASPEPVPQARSVPLQSVAKFGGGSIVALLIGLAAWQIMTREPKTADPGPAITAAAEPFGEVVSKAIGSRLDDMKAALLREIGNVQHSLDREQKSIKGDVEENKRELRNIRTYHDQSDQSWRDLDAWQRNMAAEFRALEQEVKLWTLNRNR